MVVPRDRRGLQFIQNATNLRKLYLPQSITDGDLKWIVGLTCLEELTLQGSGITDEGLRQVAMFRQLTGLSVTGGSITDVGVGHLLGLKNLEELSLSGEKVTDNGARIFQGTSKAVEIVTVTNNNHRHRAEAFGAVQNLKTLHLGWTQIGDAGLEHLAVLFRLEKLFGEQYPRHQ